MAQYGLDGGDGAAGVHQLRGTGVAQPVGCHLDASALTGQLDAQMDEAPAQCQMADYFRAMEQIEGVQTAVFPQKTDAEKAITLLDKLGQDGLNAKQQQILAELRRCLSQPATTNQNQPWKLLLTNE